MKLSKQERIAALVIAIIIILAVGIFMFIKPRFETIGTTAATLATKQTELDAAIAKRETKDDLKTQVMDAYEKGEHLADMFFPELSTYDAEKEFRDFLAQCKANVIVESVNVSEPGTTTLDTSFYQKNDVTYDLKTYVTQGLDTTEEELAAQNRLQVLQDALGGAQTIGSTTIDFSVTALDQEELLKFCDEVNEYFKEENGTSTRKAIMLDGVVISYPLVEQEDEQIVAELTEKAETDGTKALYKNAGLPVPASDGSSASSGTEAGGDEKISVSDYIYTVSTKITFFSVERMLDPTDQLDAQDGIVY